MMMEMPRRKKTETIKLKEMFKNDPHIKELNTLLNEVQKWENADSRSLAETEHLLRRLTSAIEAFLEEEWELAP